MAKKLLQEGLQEEGLKKLPGFKISVNEGYDHKELAAIIIKSWKKNLGIEAEIEVLKWEDQLANRYSGNYTVSRVPGRLILTIRLISWSFLHQQARIIIQAGTINNTMLTYSRPAKRITRRRGWHCTPSRRSC